MTTALALKRAGIAYKIYESAPELEPVGAGIIMANNAMQALKHWGLSEAVAAAGNRISALHLTMPGMEKLSTSDLTYFEKQYGLSNIAIHRADLHRILARAAGPEHIVLGKRLEQIGRKEERYSLSFSDGTTIEAEHVIGADGIRSQVRGMLFPENVLRDAGQTCWRGVTDFDLPAAYHHELNEAWGKGMRFGFVKLNARRVYWYLLIDNDLADTGSDIFPFLKQFHPIAAQLVQATPREQWIIAPLFDLKPTQEWSRGQVCLIGDAAHATTPNLGQGACQAIEDAYVLDALLEQHSLTAAMGLYPAIRKKKAHYVVNTSWRFGKLSHLKHPLSIALRNLIMKATVRINRKQLKRIFTLDGI